MSLLYWSPRQAARGGPASARTGPSTNANATTDAMGRVLTIGWSDAVVDELRRRCRRPGAGFDLDDPKHAARLPESEEVVASTPAAINATVRRYRATLHGPAVIRHARCPSWPRPPGR
jgi:hypothetical protein